MTYGNGEKAWKDIAVEMPLSVERTVIAYVGICRIAVIVQWVAINMLA